MKEISDAELLAALLPNSPAELEVRQEAPVVPAVAPMTVAYRQAPDGTLVPFYAPVTTVAMAEPADASGPLVPRWAVGAAVTSVGVGAGGWMLASAFHMVSSAMAAFAAGATTVLPFLAVAGVAVAAFWSRRGNGRGNGPVNVTQSVATTFTQTITNSVRIGE